MKFTSFKSLPLNTQRLMGLGAVLALLVALPLFIWAVVTQKFLIFKKAQGIQRVNVTTEGAPYIGPLTAPITIVEFSDFECPFCKSFHEETFQALLDAYPNQIRFVYRNFPLTQLHPNAEIAAEASLCANEQGGFWQMADLLFANQGNLGIDSLKSLAAGLELNTTQFDLCLDTSKYSETIQQDITDGTSYGITGTPYFFVNGIPLAGAYPLSEFQQIIDQELNPTPSPTASASPTESPTASPSGSPTASPTEIPTATPTATPTPEPGNPSTNACGGTCGSIYNCNINLFCHQGFCRNPDCPNDTTCECKATPTPKPTPTKKPAARPTPTSEVVYLSPRPEGTPVVGITRVPVTPTPEAVIPPTQQGPGYLLWISAGTFATAIMLILFAL